MSKFKEFFSFNKNERRGVFVLLLLIMALLLYRIFGPFSVGRIVDQKDFEFQATQFLKTRNLKTEEKKEQVKNLKEKPKTPKRPQQLQLHPFDPNAMSLNQWIKMGLSERQAHTIEKYKSKGGTFRKPEDFKKIYCISESEYEELSPYIIINIQDDDDELYYSEPILELDLNTVNMEEIQCVRGIGPSYAKRIIKYRQILGGYIQLNQLLEVYGMDSLKYIAIKPYFTLSMDSVKRIPLNTATYSQLRRHPYVSDQLAYEITHYRNMHGYFKNLEELKEINLITDSLYQRIYLYFAAELK